MGDDGDDALQNHGMSPIELTGTYASRVYRRGSYLSNGYKCYVGAYTIKFSYDYELSANDEGDLYISSITMAQAILNEETYVNRVLYDYIDYTFESCTYTLSNDRKTITMNLTLYVEAITKDGEELTWRQGFHDTMHADDL